MIKKENLQKIAKKLAADKLDFISTFRRNLYLYLDNKEITMSELSESSDVNLSTLKTFMYGSTKDISLTTAVKLARALDVSIDELVGAETITEPSRESLRMCRELPESDLYLVRWFIRYLYKENEKHEPNKRYVSVMEVLCNENGNLKITSNYRHIDITNVYEEFKGKVFFGITMPCDHYMPTYSPYDMLLIANDRLPNFNENCLIRMNGLLHIAKRRVENGIAKYYSIRDGKFRVEEKDINELVGYVAYVVKG